MRVPEESGRISLELFHLNRHDGGVHNKDPVVFAPVERKKIEAVSLGVVLRDSADHLAIRKFDRQLTSDGRLHRVIGFVLRKKNRLQFLERHLNRFAVITLDAENLAIGIGREQSRAPRFAIAIAQHDFRIAGHQNSSRPHRSCRWMSPSTRISPSVMNSDVILRCSMICRAAEASSLPSIVNGFRFMQSPAFFLTMSSSRCRSRRRSPSLMTPSRTRSLRTTAVMPKPFFDISRSKE